MTVLKLGRRSLSSLPEVERTTVFYDAEVKGFGLRVTPGSARSPGGSRTWIVEYRPGAGGRNVAKKRISLGSTAALSPERAREAAKTMLAEVRLGGDPLAVRQDQRGAQSLQALRAIYAEHTDAVRKTRTVQLYKGYWDNHILPVLGTAAASRVSKADIARLHRMVGQKNKPTANRLLSLLAHFYNWAADMGYVPKRYNPCLDVQRFPESSRERFLSENEFSRLGAALIEAETAGVVWVREQHESVLTKHAPTNPAHRLTRVDPDAADAIRLLIFYRRKTA